MAENSYLLHASSISTRVIRMIGGMITAATAALSAMPADERTWTVLYMNPMVALAVLGGGVVGWISQKNGG